MEVFWSNFSSRIELRFGTWLNESQSCGKLNLNNENFNLNSQCCFTHIHFRSNLVSFWLKNIIFAKISKISTLGVTSHLKCLFISVLIIPESKFINPCFYIYTVVRSAPRYLWKKITFKKIPFFIKTSTFHALKVSSIFWTKCVGDSRVVGKSSWKNEVVRNFDVALENKVGKCPTKLVNWFNDTFQDPL